MDKEKIVFLEDGKAAELQTNVMGPTLKRWETRSPIILLFDRSCPFTTGIYIDRAVKKRGIEIAPAGHQTPVDTPVIMIDDSSHWTGEHEWIGEFPRRCFWAIDTHVAYPRILEIARHFPLVYAAQRDGTERLRSDGINALWLPVAAEPDGYHRDRGVERDIDVAFVGNQLSEKRREIIRLVDAAFDNFVIDNSGNPERISEIYSRAKVVINHSIRNDVNMRIFEAASCGAAIVTNRLPFSQCVGWNLERWEYDGPHNIVAVIVDALSEDEARNAATSRNKTMILACHTYAHRLETMLAGLAQIS